MNVQICSLIKNNNTATAHTQMLTNDVTFYLDKHAGKTR